MFKKLIASAVLALLLMVIALPACAAYCTACGVSISDSAHLCPRCGARQMPSSAALAITRVWSNGDGTVTVSWSGGAGPYTIHCVQMLSASIHDDLQSGASLGLQDASTEPFTGYSGRASLLVPGQDYWIVVRDAKGRISYQPYIPGDAPVFTAFPIGITQQQPHPGGHDRPRIILTCPPMTSPCGYAALLCITAPNGAVHTVTATDVILPAGSTVIPVPGCDLTDYFSLLQARFGSVPTGTYTLTLFLDGMCAIRQTFCTTD